MSKFQLVTSIFFVAVGILGLLMFSGFIEVPWRSPDDTVGGSRRKTVEITMWGTLDSKSVTSALNVFNDAEDKNIKISYVKKNEETFEIELLRAVTGGTAPDIVLIPDGLLISIESELAVYPFISLDERLFRELFIEGSETFLNVEGAELMPILADPIVVYWNRDTFNTSRITEVPEEWDNLMDFAKNVTVRDQRGRILYSAVALGESTNINHNKEILSALFLQSGNEIISKTKTINKFELNVTLGSSPKKEEYGEIDKRGISALSYYVGFSDPAKSHYSWNSSFINSIDAFAAGDLAIYFGRASDVKIINNLNPHLNYDVAPIPQLSSGGISVTSGRIYGLGLVNASLNKQKSFEAIYKIAISGSDTINALSKNLFLPPAKRSLLSVGAQDPLMSTFYKEAVILKIWPDPNPEETDKIFNSMISDVVSKRKGITSAITDASNKLRLLIK